jgi:hypothetical protein
MATQSIPGFVPKRETYAVHNARPDPIEFMWGGVRFEIPGCEVVGPNPARFDDGTPIPGTVEVKDGYILDAQQQMPSGPPNWSAKEAVRAVLGVQTDGKATSKLAGNGVSFLPAGCSREDFQRIREMGTARYQESLVGWATDVLQNYEEARNRAKQAGVDGKPPGQDFYRAQAILKAHEAKQQKLFGMPVEEAEVDDDLEFQIFAKATAMRMAAGIAEEQNVDKAKLVEKMLEDPMVVGQLKKKYSWRKRGHMDMGVAEPPEAEQPPE